MEVFRIITGNMRTNCFILAKENSNSCLIIDPGNDAGKIESFLTEKHYTPAAVLLTHGHFDHILGLRKLKKIYNLPVYALEEEKTLLGDAQLNASAVFQDAYVLTPDVCFHDGDTIKLADLVLKVIATPGHTAGSCCFYAEEEKLLFTGDTLFFRSIGSTEFPTGDFETLCNSLKKLLKFSDDTTVLSGHGPDTTIGSEKSNNPYLRGL